MGIIYALPEFLLQIILLHTNEWHIKDTLEDII